MDGSITQLSFKADRDVTQITGLNLKKNITDTYNIKPLSKSLNDNVSLDVDINVHIFYCYVESMFWGNPAVPMSIDCPEAIESGLCRDAL